MLFRWLLILTLMLLVGCTRSATGNLKITVAGLPAGANADITVTGPNYSRKFTGTTTLSRLGVGSYTVTVAEVSPSSVAYLGIPANQTVPVVSGNTANASVEYVRKNVEESQGNNDKSGAQLLYYGVRASGAVETPGDHDWYRFVAQAGDFVKVKVEARTLSAAWGNGDGANGVYLELYDSGSTPPNFLAFSDFTSTIATLDNEYDPPGDGVLTHRISQAGTYFVRAYGRYSNQGSAGHTYRLNLGKTSVPWSSDNMRVVGGHLKDYERDSNDVPGVSILANAVVDIYAPEGDFDPTGKFTYSVTGPAGWNNGLPFSGSVDFYGHQVAIVFTKDPDVSPTSLGEASGLSNTSIHVARVEPLQLGTYTLSLEVHGKALSKSFSINSVDALPIPQNVVVTLDSSSSLKVSWSAVAGAKKYVVFVYRPDGSVARGIVTPPTTTTVVQLFTPMKSGDKHKVQVFAHDFNFLVDILGGKYNKSGNLITEFTYVAP